MELVVSRDTYQLTLIRASTTMITKKKKKELRNE